ncbi:hypothetical protein B0H11DRAFT_2098561 [Mycena galericulata]|nr:hypothetical protein B0H11DRAFT_2098561 [Mycena galericulata]
MHPLELDVIELGASGLVPLTRPQLIFTVLRRSCPASAARPTQELATWPGMFHYAYALLYHLCHPLLLSFTSGTVDPSLSAHPNGTSQPISHQYIQVHAPPTNLDLIASRASSFDEGPACGHLCIYPADGLRTDAMGDTLPTYIRLCQDLRYMGTFAIIPGFRGGRGAMHYQHTYTVGLSQIPITSKVAT